jgi:hypothetical protein
MWPPLPQEELGAGVVMKPCPRGRIMMPNGERKNKWGTPAFGVDRFRWHREDIGERAVDP